MKCDNQYCKYRNEARPNGCYWETERENCRYNTAEELPDEIEAYHSQLKDAIFTIKKHCDRFTNCKGCCFDSDKQYCVFTITPPNSWDLAYIEKSIQEEEKELKGSAKC